MSFFMNVAFGQTVNQTFMRGAMSSVYRSESFTERSWVRILVKAGHSIDGMYIVNKGSQPYGTHQNILRREQMIVPP